jgi:hypothetical protein
MRPRPPALSMAGSTVVAGQEDIVTAFNAADGHKLWSKTGQKYCSFGDKMAGGDRLVLVREACYAQRPERVLALDPTTGSGKWSATVEEGAFVTDILSATPALVRTMGRGSLENTTHSYDASGKELATIGEQVDGIKLSDQFMTAGGLGSGQSRVPEWVVGTTMYVPTMAMFGDDKQGQVLAVDLTTGRRKWSSSGHVGQFQFIRADEQGVLGFENGGYQRKPRLLRLAADTGAATVVATGADADRLDVPLFADIHESGGTIVFLTTTRVLDVPAMIALR